MTQPNADQVSAEQTKNEEQLLHVFYAGIKNGILSGLVYAGVPNDRARVVAQESAAQAYDNPMHREDALLVIREALAHVDAGDRG